MSSSSIPILVKKRKRQEEEAFIDSSFSINTRGSFIITPPAPAPIRQQQQQLASKEDIDSAFKEMEKLKSASSIKTAMDSRAELEAVWNEIARIWKERIWTFWYYDANKKHECSGVPIFCQELDEIRKMPYHTRDKRLERHESCTLCAESAQKTCEMDLVNATAFKTEEGGAYHVCVENHCASLDDHSLHHTQLYVVDYLYICKKTGIHHACHEKYCMARKVKDRKGRALICSVSGRSSSDLFLEQPLEISTFARENARRGIENPLKEGFSKKHESSFSSMGVESLVANCTNPDFANSEWKKKKSFSFSSAASLSPKDDCFRMALQRCSQVFSEKHLDSYDNNKARMDAELLKDLEKSCANAQQNRKLPNTQHLRMMVDIYRKKNYLPPDMKLLAQEENRRLLITHYARQCVVFWHIIHTKTKVKEHAYFSFSDFIDSALSIFEEGLDVSTADYDYGMTLIKKDKLLNILSYDSQGMSRGGKQGRGKGKSESGGVGSEENKESSFLDRIQGKQTFGKKGSATTTPPIRAKKDRRNNRTLIKNQIQQAILETIRERVIHPDAFRLENYQYEDIPSSSFGKLATTTNAKETTTRRGTGTGSAATSNNDSTEKKIVRESPPRSST